MKTRLREHMCVVPNGTVTAAITAALENRPSVLWLDDLDRYLGVGGLSVSDIRTLVEKGVIVLATMRTHERERLSERHDLGRDHAGQRLARAGREILDTVTIEIGLPRMWSVRECEAAVGGDLTHQPLNSFPVHRPKPSVRSVSPRRLAVCRVNHVWICSISGMGHSNTGSRRAINMVVDQIADQRPNYFWQNVLPSGDLLRFTTLLDSMPRGSSACCSCPPTVEPRH